MDKTSKPKKVTLTNKGGVAPQISAVSVSASFSIAGRPNTCSGQSVAPRKSCSFDVEFAPTAVEIVNGSITVNYNGTSPAVTLTGNGVAR